ncbi:MAG: polyprenyl synthetase family protein [Bacteroidetes bacterium]|nr:polyprenyl synthetase family protein [Bacteroidota bacterium]
MHSFNELVSAFEQRFASALPFPQNPTTLYEPCRYFLTIGGKRIRPVVCLMAHELFEPLSNDAWHAAMGIELFHNFTLIHDDIMDKAPLRRNMSTVHERNGLTAGILCGDVMSIYAYEQLANINHSLSQVLHLFNTTAIEVCEGQQLDMDYEKRNIVSIDEYIEMITLKTSVLIACSLKMGGLLGGASEGNAQKLYDFGKNLGIAFQLQDDYLDAFGSSERIGKQRGGDILANKKTYLWLKAWELGKDSHRAELVDCTKRNDESKVPTVLDIFRTTGADLACRAAVESYSTAAFNSLEEVAVMSNRKKHLHDLASYLLLRDQ